MPSTSLKDLKDSASTSHNGLPEVAEGITPANIGGMGPITLPTETEVGSGDIPAGKKSDEDEEDEKQLKEKMEGLHKSFESFIQEGNFNDPVLLAFRAAKMRREAELAKPKRKPLYGKERAKAEDQLWQISQDLKDLYSDRGQLLIDMEQEAEVEGGPIADRYGVELDKIESTIQNLIAKRGQLEMRLAESKIEESEVNEGAFVIWYEDQKGKHLLGTFHNKKAAEKYKAEEEDEMLNTKGIKAVGMMSKDMWYKKEAPYINEAKFKAGQVWMWKHVDGDKEVEITDIKSNGDVVGKVVGTSDEFIVRDANKYLKNKISKSMINEKAEVTIPGYNVSNSVIRQLEREFEDMLPAGTMFAIVNNRGDKRVQIQTTTGKALYPFSGGLKGGIQQPVIVDKKMMQRALDFIEKYAKHKLGESVVNEDWGSSDQAAMNKAIHRDLGNPKKMMSPFDSKLRSAAEDAVDFWWDEWEEYKNDRDGLIDDAVRSYMRAYFPKEFAMMVKMFEAYDGNLSDFKYEFPEQFEEATGNSQKAIKKISKAGKGYEVRTSIYMSEPEMKKVGDAMGLELKSYEKSSNIAVTVYEHKLSDFGSYINAIKLDEGFFSNISIMIQNAKDQKEFVKDFFKEYGSEIKKTAETLKWVADMYSDEVYSNDDYQFLYKESVEVINEDWGTYDTPEGKMVAKELDKAWNTFAKTVNAAHNEWLKAVQKYRGDAGKGSGFSDSEGREAVMSAIEWYLEKVFKVDNKFGGLDYRKYRQLMGESVEIEEIDEARAVKRFDKKLIDHKTQPHQEGAIRTIYSGATQNVDVEVYEKWIEMKGLRDIPEDYRGQHLGSFFELKKNLYLWATDMMSAQTGRPARDSRGDAFFNVMAIFTMDGDEILTLWERPSNLPVATHGGPGVGFQYESVEIEEIDEARSINKIQKDWAKVVDTMKAKVDVWKSAEGDAKDKLLSELKTLTAQKKKLEAELNDAVSLKDIDAELASE